MLVQTGRLRRPKVVIQKDELRLRRNMYGAIAPTVIIALVRAGETVDNSAATMLW